MRQIEKNRTRSRTHAALKRGEIVRLSCEAPGCTEPDTVAHHEDYSDHLRVRWLCPTHHRDVHKGALVLPIKWPMQLPIEWPTSRPLVRRQTADWRARDLLLSRIADADCWFAVDVVADTRRLRRTVDMLAQENVVHLREGSRTYVRLGPEPPPMPSLPLIREVCTNSENS